MVNGLIEEEDLNFFLYDWLNIEEILIGSETDLDRETVDAFLNLSHMLAKDHFLPEYYCS